MKRYPFIIALIIGLAVMGGRCSLTTTVKQPVTNTTVNTTNVAVASAISYPGQEGKNALELLESTHRVDVSAQGFVNAIDGVNPGDHEFWAFYVNGKQAEVGAKEYQTKNGETIEWKLEKF